MSKTPPRTVSKTPPTLKQLLLGGGHLAALWTLAFVQPLLDLLGQNPDFFIARDNSPGDILLLAFGFTLLPPLLLLGVEAIVRRFSARAYYGLHLALMGGIVTFLFIQLISNVIPSSTALILLLAIGLGALFAWAAWRYQFLRNLLDILIIAPVVVVALFIFTSQASDVIFPSADNVAVAGDSGGDVPVVLVIFDELGTADLMTDDQKINAKRYPNFGRLAEESTWYKNQTTTAFFTPKAVPGILTGKLPRDDALATAQDQPKSLFTLLGRNRPLHVTEPLTAICPETLCQGAAPAPQRERLKSLWSDLKYVEGRLVLPPGIADRLPDVGTNFEDFGESRQAPEKVDDFLVKQGPVEFGAEKATKYHRFIQEIPQSDRGLTVMHMLLPHQPWEFDVKGRLYNKTPIDQLAEDNKNWLVDSNGIVSSQARMYVQTGFADTLLGQLQRRLERLDLWDKAVVVVTADHGVSFEGGDVPRRMVDRRAMGEVVNPPLFIKYPGQKQGEVSEKHSTTLDIVPTIAEALSIENPYRFDGVPLQGPVPERSITVEDIQNRKTTVELPEVIAQRDAAIKRTDERLGSGPLYTLGPAPDLIGRPAPPVPEASTTAVLDKPSLWDDYKPDQMWIPINVTGVLEGDADTDMTLAVGVNGRIEGTARSFEFDGATRFGTLINPESLSPGRNEITVHAVDGDRLTPLGSN